MNHSERKLRSIPPKTALGVLRGNGIQIGEGDLPGGVRTISREPISQERYGNQTVSHVVQKPPSSERARPELPDKRDGKIKWNSEVIEDYNGKGDLGIILQFAGIEFTEVSSLRSRHNRPGMPVLYIPVGYLSKTARLILATRGDIFEFQIVPSQMDVNPFLREELYLPQLATTHDPASMTVLQNNKIVTVSYNPRTYY